MFNDLPEHFSPEKLDNLVNQLKEGNESVIHPIIMGHMRLGTSIVMKYSKRFPFRHDDLLGEMSLALTKAVKDCAPPKLKLYDNNITAYIAKTIKFKLKTYIAMDRTFGMPDRTIRHHVQKGNLKKLERLPVQAQLGIYDENRSYKIDDSNQSVRVSQSNYVDGFIVTPKTEPNEIHEIKDILQASTFDLIEKRIIELRAEGYTYAEIGPQVGLSTSQIGVKVTTIEQRFEHYYKRG